MKQFNVHDETHQLGKELSLKMKKSLIDVVQEALVMYRDKFEKEGDDDKLVDRFLREASEGLAVTVAAVMTGALTKMAQMLEEAQVTSLSIVRTEVPIVIEATVEKLRKAQEELEAEQLRELERLLAEAETERDAVAADSSADGAVEVDML